MQSLFKINGNICRKEQSIYGNFIFYIYRHVIQYIKTGSRDLNIIHE